MKIFSIIAVLSVAYARQIRLAPLVEVSPHGQVIPNEYIVMLREPEMSVNEDGVYSDLVEMHLQDVFGGSFESSNDKLIHKYNLGYAAVLSESEIDRIRQMEVVDFVEASQVYRTLDFEVANATETQENPLSWGLSRVSQRDLPLDNQYVYSKKAGEGVDVYVIDNGVMVEHVDFEDRARDGKVMPAGEKYSAGNHGTHVSSSIAGAQYGIAKKANIINVKVLRTSGYGSTADVLGGIEWSANDHKRKLRTNSKAKSVANMSLGGGKSAALDAGVKNAIKAGIVFAVAAGNSNQDAGNYSPARVQEAVTVGATNKQDRRSSFSNYGRYLDIFAPGEAITGAWWEQDDENNSLTKTISGTSMASPHVAGVLALLLAEGDYTPEELKQKLLQLSTAGKVKNPGFKSPNKMLFSDPYKTFKNEPVEDVHFAEELVSPKLMKTLRFQRNQ